MLWGLPCSQCGNGKLQREFTWPPYKLDGVGWELKEWGGADTQAKGVVNGMAAVIVVVRISDGGEEGGGLNIPMTVGKWG